MRRRAVTYLSALALFSAGDAAGLVIYKIALEGEAAPGRPGETIVSLSHLFINSDGQLAVLGGTTGPFTGGAWVASSPTAPLQFVSGAGTASQPALAGDGSIYSKPTSSSISRYTPSGSQPVVVAGEPAPGSGGQVFGPLTNHAAGKDHVAIQAIHSTTPQIGGIWTHSASQGLTSVMIVGTAAPGTGLQFERLPTFQPQLAHPEGNTVAFSVELTGGVASLWTSDASGLQVVAREGAPAPGVAGAVYGPITNFASFSGYFMASNGDILFQSPLSGPGITSVNDVGVFTSRNGVVDLLLQGGASLPGTTRTFARPVELAMNADGRILLEAGLFNAAQTDEDSLHGVWRSNAAGDLVRIAIENGFVPGFDSTIRWGGAWGISQNDLGYGVVSGILSGAPTGTQQAAFLLTPDDQLQLLLRAGDLFAAAPGLELVIQNIAIGYPVTNGGLIPLRLTFTNGLEGLYVFDLETGPVPEPPLAALSVVSLVALARRAARRG